MGGWCWSCQLLDIHAACLMQALRKQQEMKEAEEAKAQQAAAAAPAHKPQHKRPLVPAKPKAKPMVVIKRTGSNQGVAAAGAATAAGKDRQPGQAQGGIASDRAPEGTRGQAEESPPSKRQRGGAAAGAAAQQRAPQQGQAAGSEALQEDEIGLPGLLGGYGSGSGDSDT
jgi:hypothetical protein